MSIETTCEKCGEEYDMRRGECPICRPAVVVKARLKHSPSNTWDEGGWIPFEMYGEQFAVTRTPCPAYTTRRWRVSHVATGVAVPLTGSETQEGAKRRGIRALMSVGPEKFKAALDQVRAQIAAAEAKGKVLT